MIRKDLIRALNLHRQFKETKKEETKKVDKNDSELEKEAKGRELTGEGTGRFGFDIDLFVLGFGWFNLLGFE